MHVNQQTLQFIAGWPCGYRDQTPSTHCNKSSPIQTRTSSKIIEPTTALYGTNTKSLSPSNETVQSQFMHRNYLSPSLFALPELPSTVQNAAALPPITEPRPSAPRNPCLLTALVESNSFSPPSTRREIQTFRHVNPTSPCHLHVITNIFHHVCRRPAVFRCCGTFKQPQTTFTSWLPSYSLLTRSSFFLAIALARSASVEAVLQRCRRIYRSKCRPCRRYRSRDTITSEMASRLRKT